MNLMASQPGCPRTVVIGLPIGIGLVRWCLLILVTQALGCGETADSVETANALKSEHRGVGFRAKAPPSNPVPPPKPNEQPVPPSGILPKLASLESESGIQFIRFDDISPQRRIQEVNGGGVAIMDYDSDGFEDVFLTNGCPLPRHPDEPGEGSQCFRNLGNLRFKNITEAARLNLGGFSTGAAVGDFDNDGFPDLYVTALGRNTLFHNYGDGTFQPTEMGRVIEIPFWSTSAAWHDVNLDGVLDLYVVNYLDVSDENPLLCPNPRSPDGYAGCSPALFDGQADVLLLGDGSGGFVDVSDRVETGNRMGKGLGVLIANLDSKPTPEIYVANDGQANFLFTHQASFLEASETKDPMATSPSVPDFLEMAQSSGTALSESGFAQASMGITAGDYDGDGRLDLFMTHFFGDTNTVYHNEGDLLFQSATRSSRLGPPSRRYLGFGTEFLDLDNDCDLDLLVCNGHVDDRTWNTPDERYRMPAQIFRNEGDGRFLETTNWGGQYFQQEWLGRGLATSDLDRDGRIDAIVSHQLANSAVLHNQTATNSGSMTIRLIGTQSSRDAFGAELFAQAGDRIVYRQILGGGSFQSSSSRDFHVGLDEFDDIPVTLRWPSGRLQKLGIMTAGHWVVREPVGATEQTRAIPLIPRDTRADVKQ